MFEFDLPDWFYKPTQADNDRGRIGLKYFHNGSIGYISYKGTTLDGLIQKLNDDESNFTGFFGYEIRKLNLNDEKLEQLMATLAKKSRGLVPSADSFKKSLTGQMTGLDYITSFSDNVPTATQEFIKQAEKDVDAVASVGFDTFKSIGTLAPIVIVGGLLIVSWSYIKKFKAA